MANGGHPKPDPKPEVSRPETEKKKPATQAGPKR